MQTQKYPYYIIPAIEALPEASGEERLKLVRKIAATVGDPTALRALIGIDPREFLDFYPDMVAPQLTTEETINSFLDRFAPASMKTEPETEELIYAPSAPYDLSQLEALPELDSDPLIPSFPAQTSPLPAQSHQLSQKSQQKNSPLAPQKSVESESPANQAYQKADSQAAPPEEPSLSESLAKIMIKNGNYQKALEIITEISLNNPKKSVYFADQIRFLKKLIKYTSVSD